MKKLLPFLLLSILLSCQKSSPLIENEAPVIARGYVLYTIEQGAHYCNSNSIKPVSLSEMNFKVKFDSSSVYITVIAANQKDVNKLYGFSEGIDHHVNSARIGWAWYKNALRLYAYTYCNGTRDFKEITAVNIGAEVVCGIKVSGSEYIFSVDKTIVSMPRAIQAPVVSGYQLYPYFGGDETAPSRIQILIQDIP